ncbi:hypothetical protein CN205_13935 [Sinorhizobium meliloti]|uniref:hypothetical protein n=1 Tax=Rhizobium meliloti TaxID=382 RepID=UPI000FDB666B|nr:hypothetical protein [Sinorhizobium meliloti]RVI06483.1 hypothetical protein CN205_13935 [Sinorhizobium meliloti]
MTQIEAEAVLCEDGRTVMVYLYRGDDLIGTGSQSLPLTITEEAFEAVRPEWEQTWGDAGPGGEVPPEIRFQGQTRATHIRAFFSAGTEFQAESKKSRITQTRPHFSSEKPSRHEGSIMKQCRCLRGRAKCQLRTKSI